MQESYNKVNPIMEKVSELNNLKQNLLFVQYKLKEYNLSGNIKEEEVNTSIKDYLKDLGLKDPSKIIFEKNKILSLLENYDTIFHNIERLEEEEVSGHKIGKIQDIYSRVVMKTLGNQLREEKKGANPYKNEDISEEDLELLKELGLSDMEDFLDTKNTEESIIEQAKKYRIFLKMRKSLEKGFFLSFREAKIFDEMLEDMKNGKPILLTGDTGSGKTELAKQVSRIFLKNRNDLEINKEALFISGSKSLETEDFTVQKIIEYTNDIMESSISDGKEDDIEKISDNFINYFNKSSELKSILELKAKENGNEEFLEEIENNEDLLKPSLTTKYHLMALLSGMKQGVPVIIDEVNTIRPEVLMSLNDLFTKNSKNNNEIQLPNGLKPIKVKEGFCIILTGNDPEDNKKAGNYSAGRYEFDSAFYNRLSVYAKGYLNQEEDKFKENNENSTTDFLKEIENLNKNELYQFILMYLYSDKNNTDYISGNKHGFKIFKKGKENEYLNKNDFFNEIKDFAKGVSMIQKLFAKEDITLVKNPGVNLASMINRKVFSMRNMIDILDDYKKSNMSLEYSIYKKFIKNTSSKEEKEAVLMVFQEVGFFEYHKNIKQALKNIEVKYSDIDKDIQITSREYKNDSFIVSKEDIYKKMFLTFGINDEILKSEKEKDISINNSENEEGKKEYSKEEIEDISTNIITSVEHLEEHLEENGSDIDLTINVNNFIISIKKVLENNNDFSGEELEQVLEFVNSLLNTSEYSDFKLLFENMLNGCNKD